MEPDVGERPHWRVRTRTPGAAKHPRVPESFGGAVGPSFHPAGRGAGRGHLELRPPSSGGAWREGAGDALSHARPVLSGLKMAAAAGVRSRRRGREKESL